MTGGAEDKSSRFLSKIQIHKIIPKKKQTNGTVVVMNDYVQYMFAIYVPKEKKYFVRGE